MFFSLLFLCRLCIKIHSHAGGRMRITCRRRSDTPILSQSLPLLLLGGLSNLVSAPAKVSGELGGTSTYDSRVTVKRINQTFLLAMSVFCV